MSEMRVRVYGRGPDGKETEILPEAVFTGSNNPYAYHPAAAFALCECDLPQCPSKIGRLR
ncbi:hypothetical protein [Kitasatospora paranensis]|uniref:Uncharacterized protein n=1 Tax=Kitasatospora paranensis TaxID=258053 RepID=A0ABW2G044_9ACTN